MPTLAVTLSGPDAPGILATLTAGLPAGVEVLDLDQGRVRGHLTAALLLRSDDVDAARRAITAAAEPLGVRVELDANPPMDSPGAEVVVTVLAAPLTAGQLALVTALIRDAGGTVLRSRRLASDPYTCLELAVGGVGLDALRPVLSVAGADHGFDVAVSLAGLVRRGRRLVVMDVDSTLVQQEVIELLAAHAGREAEVRAVTERAMRGELDFAASLTERVKALTGLPVAVFDEVRDAVRLTPGARQLVETLRSMGISVGVVSGGFMEVVAPLAADLGITHVQANRLEVVDGHLTGRVDGPIVDRAVKAQKLREWAELEQLPLERTIAVGDGANDLDMLAEAGLGIAFNAKPAVRAAAHTAINQPRLDAVLQLMGIPQAELG